MCDELFSPGWMVSRVQPPEYSVTLFAKATFKLHAGGSAEPWPEEPELVTGDTYVEEDATKGLWYPSDFAPFKPRADVLLQASAHSPEGRPTAELTVGFGVGQYWKELAVLGNRRWEQGFRGKTPSEPQPFVTMPIAYERAFGGIDSKSNPVGKGRATPDLPNIEFRRERMTSPREDWPPAGFGPLAGSWTQRRSLVGTYDNKWLDHRWPWFPEDFDWGYFNAAPRDQQIQGYLKGDEDLYFWNMHPDLPDYRTRLPGVRARCFLNESRTEEVAEKLAFREVPMHLDTLWIDMNEEKLILVWRGIAAVRSIKLGEIQHLFFVCESLASERSPLSVYQTLLAERLREGEEVEIPAEALIDPEEEADKAAIEAQVAEMDHALSQAKEEETRALAAAKGQLAAAGLDPSLADMEPPPQTIAEARATLAADVEELRKKFPSSAGELAELEIQLKQLAELEILEADFERLQAEEEEGMTRDQVAERVKRGESFAGKDLRRLDLSGLDMGGANFERADFQECNLSRSSLAGANLARARLADTDLSEADLRNAKLDGADFSGAKFGGANLMATSLNGAVFSGLDLRGLDFSTCRGDGVDFANSDLSGAQFSDAVLPKADFCGCVLEGAVFRRAELKAAQFEEVQAGHIDLAEADITGLHASDGSVFTGGVFRQARGAGSIWEGAVLDYADFSLADLTGGIFIGASLRRAIFDRAHLGSALLDDASLTETRLTNANLLRATFDRATLQGASIYGSSLYECSFCEAAIEEIDLRGANLNGTQLKDRDGSHSS